MQKEHMDLLLSEAKKNTKGWTERRQIRAYKVALIKLNEENNWDGNYATMHRPEMKFITNERKLLLEWGKVKHPPYSREKILARKR